METKHTPLPWSDLAGAVWGGPKETLVADCHVNPYDAAFIVEAVNNYAALKADRDRLREAVKALLDETPEMWGDKVEDGVLRHYYREDTVHGLAAALKASSGEGRG